MVITYTKDIDDAFFRRLRAVATDLLADPEHLLAVMCSESGVRADAHNPNGDASGIIQFMPKTLVGLGWTEGHAAFRAIDATAQLAYAQRYYHPYRYRGQLRSIAAIYVATFMPVHIRHAHDPSFVLTAKEGPYGWAYAANAVLDKNKDLTITVSELEDAVRRNTRGSQRWFELLRRLDETQTPTIDLGTVLGVQRALIALGFAPGPLDGIYGPRTRAAVVLFQRDRHIAADGIVGPITIEQFAAALEEREA